MTSQDGNENGSDLYDLDIFPVGHVVHSKHSKPDFIGRIGRLYRAENRYRKTKTHQGKGKTLRDHRRGAEQFPGRE